MLGNEFLTHGDQSTVDAIVENTNHPAAAPLGSRFRVFDEIYKFTRANRDEVTMLLSLDRHPADGLPEAGRAADLPLAWAKAHGQGRVFYTALGHREDVWENRLYQQHVLGGIRWVTRR
jgi:type 1 glutamine amidotransferase